MITFAIFEDDEYAWREGWKHFEKTTRDSSEGYRSAKDEVGPILNEGAYAGTLRWISEFRGDMAAILDLGYSLPPESRQEIAKTFSELATRGVPLHFIEGLELGREVIRNASRAVICVATGQRDPFGTADVLRDYATHLNKGEHVLIVEPHTGACLSSVRTIPNIFETLGKGCDLLFGNVLEKFFTIGDGFVPKRGSDLHGAIDTLTPDELSEWLGSLLGWDDNRDQGELIEVLLGVDKRDQLTGGLKETLKKITGGGRQCLGVAGAWLLALAAYRAVDRGNQWRSVFDCAQLRQNLTSSAAVTPYFSDGNDLRQAGAAFFRMILALAESVPPQRSPLCRVEMATTGRLCFTFEFPGVSVGKVLPERISAHRRGSLNWVGLKPDGGAHASSRAIWRFWLASALNSLPCPDGEDVLGNGWPNQGFARMRLIARNAAMEMVFE